MPSKKQRSKQQKKNKKNCMSQVHLSFSDDIYSHLEEQAIKEKVCLSQEEFDTIVSPDMKKELIRQATDPSVRGGHSFLEIYSLMTTGTLTGKEELDYKFGNFLFEEGGCLALKVISEGTGNDDIDNIIETEYELVKSLAMTLAKEFSTPFVKERVKQLLTN